MGRSIPANAGRDLHVHYRSGVNPHERDIEHLGTVRFPSGDALLYDFGLLDLWSGSGIPKLPAHLAPPEVRAQVDASVDWEIVGPDAFAVAARIDLACRMGRYLFDVRPGDPIAVQRVEAVCRETGLVAQVRPIGRLPHLERVHRLLADEPGGVEIPVNGPWGVAVRGLPRNRDLPVLGQRMDPDGPDHKRWWSIWVECASGEPTTSVEIGRVLVQEARLLFADPVVLGAWRGGRDPHNDNHRLLAQAERSPTESGTIEVAGVPVTGFFTTWGDGAFHVFAERLADGTLARFRVEPGHPEIVARQRRVNELWFGELSKLAAVSARVVRDGRPVTWLERGTPGENGPSDSGWAVGAGDESEEYLAGTGNLILVPLRELIQAEPALEQLFRMPAPVVFGRLKDGSFRALDEPT